MLIATIALVGLMNSYHFEEYCSFERDSLKSREKVKCGRRMVELDHVADSEYLLRRVWSSRRERRQENAASLLAGVGTG